MAYLGPAIGPQAFEVGDNEVRAAFVAWSRNAGYVPSRRNPGKWLANLYLP